MQHHTAALFLAYLNIGDKIKFRVRGENKAYEVILRAYRSDKIELQVVGMWSCYAELRSEKKSGGVWLEIKHPSDSASTIDEIMIYDRKFEGVFKSKDGKSYPFRGELYNKNTQVQGVLVNKKGQQEKFTFELQ